MTNNSLPGSKRDEEANLENCNSEDTTKACEPCEKSLKCLVHVEFENTQDTKKYLWKGGCGDLTSEQLTNIIGIHGDENANYAPFNLKYSIQDSKCTNGHETICSKIYYFEEDNKYGKSLYGNSKNKNTNEVDSGSESGEQEEKESQLERKDEEESELELIFNNKYLRQLSDYIPYYFSLDKDEEGNELIESIDLNLPLIGKQWGEIDNEFLSYSFDYFPESEYPGGISRILSTFKRMINFAYRSQFSHMPASRYHIAVQECNDPYTTLLDEKRPIAEELKINRLFDQASATTLVVPHYKIEYGIKVYYNSLKKGSPDGKGTPTINPSDMKITAAQRNAYKKKESENKIDDKEAAGHIYGDEEERNSEIKSEMGREATFASEIMMQWMKNLKFSFSGVEYFNGVKGGEFNVEFTEIVNNIVEIFKKTHPVFSLFATVVDFGRKLLEKGGFLTLEGVGYPATVYEVEYDPNKPNKLHKLTSFKAELPRNRAYRFDVTPPFFELSGETQLENQEGKYSVKHKDLKLELKPILAGSMTFNLAILLMKWGPIKTAFIAAQGFCVFLESSGDLVSPGSVSANIIVDSEKSVEQIEREEKASIAISLLIYCQLIVSAEINTTLSYADKADLNIPASPGLDNFNGGFDLEFKAGASFHARVWIFRLGVEAGVSAKTGFEIGVEKLSRLAEDGTAYEELIFYFLFKGLEVACFVRGTMGIDSSGSKKDDSGRYGKGSDETGYYDEQTATDRLVQQAAWDKEWNEVYDKTYQDLMWGKGEGSKSISDFSSPTGWYNYNKKQAEKAAYEAVGSEYSKKELSDLQNSWFGFKKGHAAIYKEFASEFTRISELNALLKVETDLVIREQYLLERLQLQNKLNSYIVDADLPTTPGSYHHENLTTEVEWRKELRNYLNKNFETATSFTDRNNIRNNIKKLESLDTDISSASLLPPYLALPNDTLTEQERNDLTRKLLDPLLEKTL